jgi:5-methylcytosine-specific restriction protein A
MTGFGRPLTVCGFDFGQVYGSIGDGFIHVHHLRELASIGQEYVVDQIADLRPVCTNCHAMLHSIQPALTIEKLWAIIAARR